MSTHEIKKNYEHSVWGYNYTDSLLYIQENDELLDADEKPYCYLLDTKELGKKTGQLKEEITAFFKSLRSRLESVIPVERREEIVNGFF